MFVKSFNLYVLKLVQDKYYIGKSCHNIWYRFSEHNKGRGAQWTKIYKPIMILENFESDNKFIEDILTKKYMEIYGIENVRGGSYSNIILRDWQIKALKHEFKTADDLCFNCGKLGHFSSECKKRY
jgi:predicted GIY-YIG superfamily endonuclease